VPRGASEGGKARSEAAGFAAPDGDGVSFTFTGYFCRLIL
jgi:hypothetical protein